MREPRRLLAWLTVTCVVGLVAGLARGDRPKPAPDAPVPCSAAAPCADDEVCDDGPGLCGEGKHAGVCRPRPTSCAPAETPVCGCDGHRYTSECEAARAGVDLRVTGGCGEAPGLIACGSNYCDPRVSYCEIVLSDVAELPTDRVCRPLPASCAATGSASVPCSCFAEGTKCGTFCRRVDTGEVTGFRLTCRR